VEMERKEILKLFKQLEKQPEIEFPALRQSLNAQKEQGAYVIRNRKGTVVHVGRTYRGKDGLFQRLNDHLNGRSSFVNEYLKGNGNRLRKNYTFQCLTVPSNRMRALLENYATGWLCPEHLGTGE
jgi:hypothetical protein